MKKEPLFFPFLLALSGALLLTIFLPHLHLFAFAPFLALTILRRSRIHSLWIALGSGILMDLLCSDTRFGLYALSFTSTVFLAYPLRLYFFEKNPASFSLFSTLVAAIATPFQMLFLSVFGSSIFFHFRLIVTDFLLMPFADGLFAFFWFTCPLLVYDRLHRFSKKYFRHS